MTYLKKTTEVQMASHYIQYVYVGLNGFRWPVAYYGTNNVNGHSIYLTFWSLIDELHGYGFNVHAVLMDGSNNNRQFCRLLVKPQNACALKYRASDPYKGSRHLSIIQDIKHVLKKICNSIFSSRKDGKSVRQLKFNAHFIFWEHFIDVYEFNCCSDLRLYHKLSKEHVELNNTGKMCNHLAVNVLNSDMLNLMTVHQNSLRNPDELNGIVALLQQTCILVEIFDNNSSKIESEHYGHIQELLKVLNFFHKWEEQFDNPKDKERHLITRQTRRYRFLYLWFHRHGFCCIQLRHSHYSRIFQL